MSKKKNISAGLSLLMPGDIQIEYKKDENSSDEKKCSFVVSPLESGFGITIGNALRRVLLGYIHGYSICKINIEGVTNEFACIDGVRQDVFIIVQRLKKVILKKKIEDEENSDKYEEIITIEKKGGSFTGADISKASKKFEVVNKELEICDFNDDVVFKITIYINKGVGYSPAEKFNNETDKPGDIYLDCIYSPIVNVSYNVKENFHLNEQNKNYDSLTMEVTSNGAIKAEEAVVIAAGILVDHIKLFLNNENYNYSTENNFIEEENKKRQERRELLKMKISDLMDQFSSRSYNCIFEAGIETVEELVRLSDAQLLSIRNFGKKSLAEISRFKEAHQLFLRENIGSNEDSPKGDAHSKKK